MTVRELLMASLGTPSEASLDRPCTGVTHDSRHNMAEWNAEQVASILRGERPPRLINPAAWPLYAQRFARIFGFQPGK